jgi:hypothetical protein
MKCVWCSDQVKRKGSKQLPYFTKYWKSGSMHAGCFREWIDLHWFSVPQAARPDGKYDFWYSRKENYEFTLTPVRDAFEFLDRSLA